MPSFQIIRPGRKQAVKVWTWADDLKEAQKKAVHMFGHGTTVKEETPDKKTR